MVERRLGRRLYDAVWEDMEEFRREYREGELEEDEGEALNFLVEVVGSRMRLVERAMEELGDFGGRDPVSFEPLTFYSRGRGEAGDMGEGAADEHANKSSEILRYLRHISLESRMMLLAFTEYFGHLASQHDEVRSFRERILPDGKLLSEEQAIELLSSYAARFMTLDEMRSYGIPILGHTAYVYKYEDHSWGEHIDHRVVLRVEPPGINLRLRYAEPTAAPTDEEFHSRHVGRGGTVVPPYYVPLQKKVLDELRAAEAEVSEERDGGEAPQGARIGPVLLGHIDVEEEPAKVWPGSVVDEIYTFSERLAAAFRWPSRATQARPFGMIDSPDASALFLLTGKVPSVRPLEVRPRDWRYSGSLVRRIELDVAPWVRKEDVAEAYARAQRRLVGRRNRWPSERTLEVVIFVLRHRKEPGGEKLSWNQLLEIWNREHPDKKFRNYRNLRTYFERGCRALKGFSFSNPG